MLARGALGPSACGPARRGRAYRGPRFLARTLGRCGQRVLRRPLGAIAAPTMGDEHPPREAGRSDYATAESSPGLEACERPGRYTGRSSFLPLTRGTCVCGLSRRVSRAGPFPPLRRGYGAPAAASSAAGGQAPARTAHARGVDPQAVRVRATALAPAARRGAERSRGGRRAECEAAAALFPRRRPARNREEFRATGCDGRGTRRGRTGARAAQRD
jgi:hypothetical protein